jgi:hypothetical protein
MRRPSPAPALAAALLAAGCLPTTGSPPAPGLKVELDPGAPAVRWADAFSGPDLFVLVHSSADPQWRHVVASPRGDRTVFFLRNLPPARSGDEVVVEVWDDDTLTEAEQAAVGEALAAGLVVSARVAGGRAQLIVFPAGTDPGAAAAGRLIARWNADRWEFLGRAVLRVGDNGLPSAAFANPVSVVTADGRSVIGRAYLHAGPD